MAILLIFYWIAIPVNSYSHGNNYSQAHTLTKQRIDYFIEIIILFYTFILQTKRSLRVAQSILTTPHATVIPRVDMKKNRKEESNFWNACFKKKPSLENNLKKKPNKHLRTEIWKQNWSCSSCPRKRIAMDRVLKAARSSGSLNLSNRSLRRAPNSKTISPIITFN